MAAAAAAVTVAVMGHYAVGFGQVLPAAPYSGLMPLPLMLSLLQGCFLDGPETGSPVPENSKRV